MEKSLWYADVLLPLPLPALYTYRIPDKLRNKIKSGMRVAVQFGPKRIYSALVKRIHSDKPPGYRYKDILSLLDTAPIVNDYQFTFWDWMVSYYLCTAGEVMKAALPSGLKLESESKISPFPGFRDFSSLSDSEIKILRLLEEKTTLSIREISKQKDIRNAIPMVNGLIFKKAILVEEKLVERYKPKTGTFVRLNPTLDEEKTSRILDHLLKAPKQQELILKFLEMANLFTGVAIREVKKTVLLKECGASPASLNSLVKKGILLLYTKQIGRLSMDDVPCSPLKKLNTLQHTKLMKIRELHSEKDVVLLHGVTSSGKTEIYMHLIDEYVKAGKQVLYLLPEIALTAQIIQRLKRVFGSGVGVYHSRLNDAERVEVWQNISGLKSEKSYRIILGVRSSLFLPFSNLGLIVVDEEHENTFKQYDPAPRYHARDSAIMLAKIHGAKVLLGTATPSIESYYNARTGKFGLVELMQRYEELELPEIILANFYEAHKKRVLTAHFTPQLLTAIEEAIEKEEQVILFQNRRGFSPFLECGTCSWIPRCKHCAVSLTYHKNIRRLVCHYCGFTIETPGNCDECGSPGLKTKGFGTEKIEDDLRILFPGVRVARMDLDTTRRKSSYENIIHDFDHQRIRVLVGTQMISKGLDFKNVYVVGILNADNMLNFPDFRAYERSYQLMSQVSGRAGRTKKRGKVIIQTSNPDHPVILDVVNHDFKHMYQSQLKERKYFRYPPFYRLIMISVKHYDKNKVDKASGEIARDLRKVLGDRVIGPEFPLINKIQRKYIKVILVKIERGKQVEQGKTVITDTIRHHEKNPAFRSVQVSIDVDPV
ncbi:MAG: primosomal protein N' [Bacteroidales bacterium]|nr:MAG: primosomal protein N' [Bacteroidales bacterium]